MDIREALEAALAETEAAIPAAQAEAEAASRRLAGLLDEVRGLQLALARRTPPVAVSTTRTSTTVKTVGVDAVLGAPPAEPAESEVASAEPSGGGDWASLNHMDAVLRALTEAKRPLSPKDIVRALRVVGRPDTNDQVRAALAALKKRGRVSLKGRAQWVSTSEPKTPGVQEAQTYQPAAFTLPPSGPNGLTSIPIDAGGGERDERAS
jgi:hypothetical protein